MAFDDRSEKDVQELETAVQEWEDQNGSNEFTEGVIAVISWLTQDTIQTVGHFMKEYDLQ